MLIIAVVVFLVWLWYRQQLKVIRSPADLRSSAEYYALAAKYYAKAGDLAAKAESLEESSQDFTPEIQESTQEEGSEDEITVEEAIKITQAKPKPAVFDAISENQDKLRSLESMMNMADRPDIGSAKELEEALGSFAENMLGVKFENIGDLIPPNAFDEAITTLQKFSETMKRR